MKPPARHDNLAAVVLGGGPNRLGVYRSLGRRGVKVTAVSSHPGDAALLSKFCTRVIAPCDPAHDGERYVDFLLDLPPLDPAPPVLIPTGDAEVMLMSRHRDRLRGRFRLFMPEPALIEALIDKRLFYPLALAHGLTAPRTYVPGEIESMSRELPYPCVVKPTTSWSWADAEFQRRFGVRDGWIKRVVVASRAELLDIYPRLAAFNTNLVVQEYIEGGDSALYDIYSYLDAQARPAGTFMIRKVRTFPIDGNGGDTCVESAWEEEPAAISLGFLRAIGYHGNSAVSFKRCVRSGKFYVIEVNARLARHHNMAAYCGIDLAYMGYLEASGENPPAAGAPARSVKWLSFWKDSAAFRRYRKRGDVTLGRWLSSLGGEKVRGFFARDAVPCARASGCGRSYARGRRRCAV
jgi:predicted ATP-grasp superfamily ATP-dependent carboligase